MEDACHWRPAREESCNMSQPGEPQRPRPGSRTFATTRGSVLAAGKPGTRRSDAALAVLCQTCWHPVDAFLRPGRPLVKRPGEACRTGAQLCGRMDCCGTLPLAS